MVEYNRRRIFVRLNFLFHISQLHTVLHFQHALHTVAAGDRFCHRDNQIRQLDKLYQNLGHVIDKRYDLSLGQDAGIYADCAGIQQCNDRMGFIRPEILPTYFCSPVSVSFFS